MYIYKVYSYNSYVNVSPSFIPLNTDSAMISAILSQLKELRFGNIHEAWKEDFAENQPPSVPDSQHCQEDVSSLLDGKGYNRFLLVRPVDERYIAVSHRLQEHVNGKRDLVLYPTTAIPKPNVSS